MKIADLEGDEGLKNKKRRLGGSRSVYGKVFMIRKMSAGVRGRQNVSNIMYVWGVDQHNK